MMHWGQSLGCKTGPPLYHGQYNDWKQDKMLLFIGERMYVYIFFVNIFFKLGSDLAWKILQHLR